MNKKILLIVLGLVLIGILFAQERPSQVKNAQGIVIDTEEIVIDPLTLAPVSGIYKDKADTFFNTFKFRLIFDEEKLKKDSNDLLNKWLKESK